MSSSNEALLVAVLAVAVPMWIEKVRRYTVDHRLHRAMECGDIIACKGDIIQFKSKRKGESAAAFNALAEGLACLAFSPGGVRFAGMHWEA